MTYRSCVRWWTRKIILTSLMLVLADFVFQQAVSEAQIVEPGDVATPTATFAVILMPTNTPGPDAKETPEVQSPDDPHARGVTSIASTSFATYTVQPGDTILTVALEIGSDVKDIACSVSPTFSSDQPLVIGDILEILPPSWRCHQIEAGETLSEIAAHFGIEPSQLIDVAWNRLEAANLGDKALTVGASLRIPPSFQASENGGFLNYMLEQPLSVSPMTAYAIGGSKPKNKVKIGPIPKDWPYGSGNFAWPVYGWLSQGYREDHRAIDIAAPAGTLVTAADRGVVIRAGWNDQGYGNFVVIDHKIDYITLYAHMSEILVKVGDVVGQGQILGTIGSTGNSTGPHLHFEIRDFGMRINPLDLLVH